MSYVVHYGTLRTGADISVLPATSCTFGDELKGPGSFTASVAVGQANGGALWDETRGATSFWAVEWSSDFGREIVAAGPIFARSGDDDGITYGGSNLFGMMGHRRLIGTGWTDAQIPALALTYSGLDLGSIMRAVVVETCTAPPADLPIVFEAPRAGLNERTYNGYDFGDVGQAMTNLGAVEEGTFGLGAPDWIFAPRFKGGATSAVDFTHIEWALRTGTATAPALTSPAALVLDRGAPGQQTVGAVSVVEDASALATRAWVTGAGTEKAKVIASSTDSTLTDAGYPRMDVATSSNALVYATVKAQSAASLTGSKRTPSATTVSVRAEFWWANGSGTGTTVRLLDPRHPVFGPVDLTSRVLAWSGDVASSWVTLTLADSLAEV